MKISDWPLTKKSIALSLIGTAIPFVAPIIIPEYFGGIAGITRSLVVWIIPCALGFISAGVAVRRQEPHAIRAFAITTVLVIIPAGLIAYSVFLDSVAFRW